MQHHAENGNEAPAWRLRPNDARGGFLVTLDRCDATHANLYARLLDAPESPGLCLAGHIDTVTARAAGWSTPPLQADERQGRLYGRGSCDMKGGVAALLCAAAAMRPRLRPGQDLRVHLYGGEEVGCLGSRHMAERRPEELAGVGAAIVAEPTALLPSVGHRGALWLRVTASGNAAHASMPQLGDNALTRLLPVAARIQAYDAGKWRHPQMGPATLTLTTLHAGSGCNMVPDAAGLTVDIRTVPGQDQGAVLADIRDLAGEACRVEVLTRVPSLWTPPDLPWVRRVARLAHGAAGQTPAPVTSQFFTDGASLRLAKPELPIIILGPGEQGVAHQTNEWCAVPQLCRAVDVYMAILADWYGV
jgi:succinyl-diaminopimelate desuccinylase